MNVGFIGQGYVGGSYANDFERRGYQVVRYSLADEHQCNKESIKDCDIVFIAVPTPTTPDGFDVSIVESVLPLVGEGKVAMIKSTLLPGTTTALQDKFSDRIILFSPEFLMEKTAAYDAAHPFCNVIGIPYDTAGHRRAAETVRKILPMSEYNFVVPSQAAELFKYAHNLNGYMRVMLSNLLYDAGLKIEVDWADMKSMIDADPMMSPYYNTPVHKGGRGAGGACFIKDMASFRNLYERLCPEDEKGVAVFKALEEKNLDLLSRTGKSQDLVKGVYGEDESKK